jgi:putative DNA primase/helicase
MLNLGSELNGKEVEESSNFKKLVSGEWINVRPIYGAPEDMQTWCKLWFLSNNMPRFSWGTDAETRRLRILYFGVKPKEKDPKLKEKLRAESSGILNWMLVGLLWLLKNKRIPNGGGTTAKMLERFDRGNDPVGAFLRERCGFGPDERALKSDVFASFKAWCEEAGLPSERLENLFFKKLANDHADIQTKRLKVGGKRDYYLIGLGLKSEEVAAAEDMPMGKKMEWSAKLKGKETAD